MNLPKLKDPSKIFDRSTGNLIYTDPAYKGGWGNNFILSQSGGNLGACGATTGNGCGGAIQNGTKETVLQDFCYFVRKTLGRKTLFYLPVTYQMPLLEQKGTFLNMMREIGAKEVHSNPNRIHGPNLMHLWVYDPGCPEALAATEKLLVKVQYPDRYGYPYTTEIPRHMFEKDQAGVAPEVAAKPVPKPQKTFNLDWVDIQPVKPVWPNKVPPPKPKGPVRDKWVALQRRLEGFK